MITPPDPYSEPRTAAMYRLVHDSPVGLRIGDIAAQLGISQSAAKSRLWRLRQRGLVAALDPASRACLWVAPAKHLAKTAASSRHGEGPAVRVSTMAA